MILDTNALSDWAKADGGLIAVLPPALDILLPVIALGEYLAGVIRIRERRRREQASAWLIQILSQVRVAPVTLATAQHYGAIVAATKARGNTIPANDAWIAAIAREYELPVISRDAHFDAVDGLHRVTW